jgi:hypothetical protein
MRLKSCLIVAASLSAWSAQAQTVEPGGRGLKILAAFNDAGPTNKLIVLGLLACAIAALVIAVRGRLGRASAGAGFVSGLRVGGPLIALAAVFHNLLAWNVYQAWFNRPPSPLQLAQGNAELALIAVAGALASAVAVFSLAHLRAVHDRRLGQESGGE